MNTHPVVGVWAPGAEPGEAAGPRGSWTPAMVAVLLAVLLPLAPSGHPVSPTPGQRWLWAEEEAAGGGRGGKGPFPLRRRDGHVRAVMALGILSWGLTHPLLCPLAPSPSAHTRVTVGSSLVGDSPRPAAPASPAPLQLLLLLRTETSLGKGRAGRGRLLRPGLGTKYGENKGLWETWLLLWAPDKPARPGRVSCLLCEDVVSRGSATWSSKPLSQETVPRMTHPVENNTAQGNGCHLETATDDVWAGLGLGKERGRDRGSVESWRPLQAAMRVQCRGSRQRPLGACRAGNLRWKQGETVPNRSHCRSRP